MFSKTIALIPLALGAVLAASLPGHPSLCNVEPGVEHEGFMMQYAQTAQNGSDIAARSLELGTIRVFAHVVAKSEQPSDGWISDEAIHSQVAVLTQQFAPVGLSFALTDIDRIVNGQWAVNQQTQAMKTQLRKGNYRDLNLYFLAHLEAATMGFCSLPVPAAPKSPQLVDDGCIILFSTLPGGSASIGYNKGWIAVHEVGHWLGLLHTFHGSCDGPGDLVDDTPPQIRPTRGCPAKGETCPNQSGGDNLHNFMDYSDE